MVKYNAAEPDILTFSPYSSKYTGSHSYYDTTQRNIFVRPSLSTKYQFNVKLKANSL